MRRTKPVAAFLRGGQVLLHAVARVEQDGERDRLLDAREERDGLLDAVLEHLEGVLLESGVVFPPSVTGDAERTRSHTPAGTVPAARHRPRRSGARTTIAAAGDAIVPGSPAAPTFDAARERSRRAG
jgi:hypothetical protein